MPLMMMGGDDFGEWFEAAGKGAGIQTFFSYRNGPHIAPQIAAVGRENVFVSTGIPCGCCKYDAPMSQPMNESLAMWYIDDELHQLVTSYTDLLLFHHRCRSDEETIVVWRAFEAAKRAGKARHIGVSNFNAHDLALLVAAAIEPVEVLEAHFGVGVMDFEILELAARHRIHPIAFASLSMRSTDQPLIRAAVEAFGTVVRWVPGARQIADAMTKDEGAAMDSFKGVMAARTYNIGDESRALELRAEAKEARVARGAIRKAENEKQQKNKKVSRDEKEADANQLNSKVMGTA